MKWALAILAPALLVVAAVAPPMESAPTEVFRPRGPLEPSTVVAHEGGAP